MLQMFDAVRLLHQEAKFMKREINLEKFRVDKNGQVGIIDFEILAEYNDCHKTSSNSQ